MDKRTAKREALKIWKWLSENDGKSESDYARAVDRGLRDSYCGCPLGAYLPDLTDSGCLSCPLWNKATFTGCMTGNSQYRAWSNNGHRAKDAKEVYELIKAWRVR